MRNKRFIILISGTPGTGETTIAQLLKEKITAKHINLTEIAIKNNFILETDEERQTKVVDIEKLISFIINLINNIPDDIIIEGHYADIIPDSYTSILIILRTEPHVLEQRLKEKHFVLSKIRENLQSEILGSCTSSALETHNQDKIYEVDNTSASIQEVLEIIITLIEKKPPSNVGEINWMKKLEENNELLKFFN